MAEPPKTPTKVASRVCRTCNENVVVENHPLDSFGAKASQENISSVLERFFELNVAFDDGLPSCNCKCCYHIVMKFQKNRVFEATTRVSFSCQKRKNNGREFIGKFPTNETWPREERNLRRRTRKSALPQMHMDKPSKTRPRTILPAPSAEGDGKNESLQRELNPQQSPQRHQNKKKFSRSLVCWTHWYCKYLYTVTYY